MSKSDKIIVIHLTDDDPMKAGKALRFASKALTYASGVVLLLSAQGVNTVNRSGGGFTIPGTETNSLDAVRELLKDGARIYVGKDCLKILKLSPTDIIAGCEPSEPSITFDLLLSDDTAVISW
jgi:predicted peroxiredoxin